MAALPYMQLHIAEYLADTSHLSAEEHGAYLLLIFNYWQRGKALDNSNGRLSNVVRMSNERWLVVSVTLREFFSVDGDTWSHGRIERDLESVNAKCRQAKNARSQRKPNGRSTDAGTPVGTDVGTDDQRPFNEEKREEEKKEEEKKVTQGDETPDQRLRPEQLAKEVQLRSQLSDSLGRLGLCLTEQCRFAQKDSADEVIAERMSSAWLLLQSSKPKLDYAWGAEKFFGEGHWKDGAGWPWKEGMAPPNEKRMRTALDILREQEGCDAGT
jgi:uncharacterized protein YdaU (DUF1376 family)